MAQFQQKTKEASWEKYNILHILVRINNIHNSGKKDYFYHRFSREARTSESYQKNKLIESLKLKKLL